MHLYLRSIGFDSITNATSEKRLLNEVIDKAITGKRIRYNPETGTGIIATTFGGDFGICIKGTYNGCEKFVMEYYFPFLLSDCATNIEELNIERHADKDSYAVVCDEVKAGVTLIFYLQNIADYYDYAAKGETICGHTVCLSGLSLKGKILLPIRKSEKQIEKLKADALVRNNLINAARNGDEEAIENLTIEDLDTYSQISQRVMREDIYSIVDSTFMPYGVECDQYAVIGDILDVEYATNNYSNESICIMTLDCNDVVIRTAINTRDLLGEPMAGRRFKGSLWISAQVNFD
ncbi:MAG: DUF3881 family protein [Lachnospiraceae bacterium]